MTMTEYPPPDPHTAPAPPDPTPVDLSRFVPNPLLRAELAAEIGRLRGLVLSLADRCHRQSELLARRAEQPPPNQPGAT